MPRRTWWCRRVSVSAWKPNQIPTTAPRGQGGLDRRDRGLRSIVDHQGVVDRHGAGGRVDDRRFDERGLVRIGFMAGPGRRVGRGEAVGRGQSCSSKCGRRHDQRAVRVRGPGRRRWRIGRRGCRGAGRGHNRGRASGGRGGGGSSGRPCRRARARRRVGEPVEEAVDERGGAAGRWAPPGLRGVDDGHGPAKGVTVPPARPHRPEERREGAGSVVGGCGRSGCGRPRGGGLAVSARVTSPRVIAIRPAVRTCGRSGERAGRGASYVGG